MSSYYVEYTAFVDERKRPEGFPRYVKVKDTYTNVENIDHLQQIVNERVKVLATGSGIVALKDPDKPLEQGVITFDQRIFVWSHMLTHMEISKVALITEPIIGAPYSIAQAEPAPVKKTKETVN